MGVLGLALCTLLIDATNVAAAASVSRDSNLRGDHGGIASSEIHLRLSKPQQGRGEPGFGPDPGPVGEKPAPIEHAEAVHDEFLAPFASLKNMALISWRQLIITSSVWIILVFLVALCYKSSSNYIPERGPKQNDAFGTQTEFSEWQSSWYQCHHYPGIFAWACCCPCIRWAHTMDLLQFLDYWPAFFLFFLLEVFNQLTAFIFVGVFITMLLVFYRQKTRKLFGMSNQGTCTGYSLDCLGLCFCWPCLIAQEAHHITEAAKRGWNKDLAVKTGPFSARGSSRGSTGGSTWETEENQPGKTAARPAHLPRLHVPANVPAASPSLSRELSPSGSAFHTPRDH